MTPALRFGHLVLRTNRLAEMQAWYSALLGARVVASAPTLVFLSYDDEHHRIALVDPGPLAPSGEDRPGLAHVAFAHPELRDLLATFLRLAELGIRPGRAVNHGLSASLYYRDPDGNWLELYADCGRLPAAKLAEMAQVASPAWDPSRLAHELASGASESELLAKLLADSPLGREDPVGPEDPPAAGTELQRT